MQSIRCIRAGRERKVDRPRRNQKAVRNRNVSAFHTTSNTPNDRGQPSWRAAEYAWQPPPSPPLLPVLEYEHTRRLGLGLVSGGFAIMLAYKHEVSTW